MEKNYNTPMHGVDEEKDIGETRIKGQEDSHREGESEQPGSDINNGEQINYGERMTEIEVKIREIEQRLMQITEEKAREDDEFTERYSDLEDERKCLRQELIQLDYEHQHYYRQLRKQHQDEDKRAEEEQLERIREEEKRAAEERLERSRRLEEKLTEIQEEGRKRREKLVSELEERKEREKEDRKRKEEERGKMEEKRESKIEGKSEELSAEEGALEKAEREARIRAIELELATDSLRRSRQLALESELLALRSYLPVYWPPRYYYGGYVPRLWGYPYLGLSYVPPYLPSYTLYPRYDPLLYYPYL